MLNLHYNGLTAIEHLQLLPCLTDLRLSSNEITSMAGSARPRRPARAPPARRCLSAAPRSLEGLAALRNLDMSCNRIAVVEGLAGLLALETLTLSYNRIRSLQGAARPPCERERERE